MFSVFWSVFFYWFVYVVFIFVGIYVVVCCDFYFVLDYCFEVGDDVFEYVCCYDDIIVFGIFDYLYVIGVYMVVVCFDIGKVFCDILVSVLLKVVFVGEYISFCNEC